MNRLIVVLVFVLFGCLILAGCTSSDEPAVESEQQPLDEEAVAAARTRGVPDRGRSEDTKLEPVVILSEITYEWRTSPDRGLQVTLDFTNPADSSTKTATTSASVSTRHPSPPAASSSASTYRSKASPAGKPDATVHSSTS